MQKIKNYGSIKKQDTGTGSYSSSNVTHTNYVLGDISNRGLNYGVKPEIVKSKSVTSPKKNVATAVNAEAVAIVANNLTMMKFDEPQALKKSPEKAFLENLEKYLLTKDYDVKTTNGVGDLNNSAIGSVNSLVGSNGSSLDVSCGLSRLDASDEVASGNAGVGEPANTENGKL